RHIGEDVAEYLNPESKAQQMVLDNIARIYEYPREKIEIGIDGCSAPNFGMPLSRTAVAFQKLAIGRDDTEENSKILVRIKAAMTEYPEMFSGKDRFDLALMQSFPGNIVCKGGAEAIQGIGFSEPSIGLAIKIEDGNFRAIYPVCIEVLKQLGLIDDISKKKFLLPFYNTEIRNAMNLLTGRIVPEFRLKKT
ncbi:MAG: asparaginase, partial [Candidatus Zixiibacteriota bacterium]